MKICEIINESENDYLIGYLFYFEKHGVYSIELPERPESDKVPLFLLSFVKKNNTTVDPDWSRRWVETRIVPSDRQNLGMILRDNGLKEYDTFQLLMLGKGRCAQDDCMVRPVKENKMSEWIRERLKRKVNFVSEINKGTLLVSFADGTLRKITIKDSSEQPELFPGGLGIRLRRQGFISAEKLYKKGTLLPFNSEELVHIIKSFVMDTPEVCELLGCSRQYVDQLVKKNMIEVVKTTGNNRLYSAGSIMALYVK